MQSLTAVLTTRHSHFIYVYILNRGVKRSITAEGDFEKVLIFQVTRTER